MESCEGCHVIQLIYKYKLVRGSTILVRWKMSMRTDLVQVIY